MNKELQFDDLHEFWDYVCKDSTAYIKSSRASKDINWAGTATWSEAKNLALAGWKDGLAEVDKYRAEILPRITDKVIRTRQVYAVSGYNVDVGAFLSNHPECFINRELEERNYPGRIFRLVCSVSFSASTKKETIIKRGAMICALVDALEYAGHRAEVVASGAFSYYNSEDARQGKQKHRGWFEVSVSCKKADQPIDMSDLAFCLAHPAMLRRMMFSAAEIEGWSDFADRYGYPAKASDEGDLYIDEIYGTTDENNLAINWVLEKLKELGVNIEEA